jgi:hypothetical protein
VIWKRALLGVVVASTMGLLSAAAATRDARLMWLGVVGIGLDGMAAAAVVTDEQVKRWPSGGLLLLPLKFLLSGRHLRVVYFALGFGIATWGGVNVVRTFAGALAS